MEPINEGIRVAVVGVGLVGSTFAYTLMLSGVASELVLIDISRDKAEGDAMDLNHSQAFAKPMRIWAGTYADTASADVIVIAAGANQKPGETRIDLAHKNTGIFRSIIGEIMKYNPKGIILVATNPVDILTYVTIKISGLPSNRVLGSGTIIDTARFRYLLGRCANVDARSVHAYIIGEHGDSEIPVWSLVSVGGMHIEEFAQLSGCPYAAQRDQIFADVRDAAYHIIEKKGATYYAIAAGLQRIVEAILRDEHSVMSVSTLLNDFHGISGICLGVPCVISRSGIDRVIELPLNQTELAGLRNSAEVLRGIISDIGL